MDEVSVISSPPEFARGISDRYVSVAKDPRLRKARVCYNHLAGGYGFQMLDCFSTTGFVEIQKVYAIDLTPKGRGFTKLLLMGENYSFDAIIVSYTSDLEMRL